MAKHVHGVVLSFLMTTVQKVRPKEPWCDLTITGKFDTAKLDKKLFSHGGGWGGARLSPGLGIGRTSDLESLGLNGSKHMVLPFQMCIEAEGVCTVVWLAHCSPKHDFWLS